MPLPRFASLAALLAIALALPAIADDEPPKAPAPEPDAGVRARLAVLELDEAQKELAILKTAAKSTREKDTVKWLERELAQAKKLPPIQKKVRERSAERLSLRNDSGPS